MRKYDKDTYYKPEKRFDYSIIKVAKQCISQLLTFTAQLWMLSYVYMQIYSHRMSSFTSRITKIYENLKSEDLSINFKDLFLLKLLFSISILRMFTMFTEINLLNVAIYESLCLKSCIFLIWQTQPLQGALKNSSWKGFGLWNSPIFTLLLLRYYSVCLFTINNWINPPSTSKTLIF